MDVDYDCGGCRNWCIGVPEIPGPGVCGSNSLGIDWNFFTLEWHGSDSDPIRQSGIGNYIDCIHRFSAREEKTPCELGTITRGGENQSIKNYKSLLSGEN